MEGNLQKTFEKVANIIDDARNNTFKKVNEELVLMYWNIGAFISEEANKADFEDAYVDSLSRDLLKN